VMLCAPATHGREGDASSRHIGPDNAKHLLQRGPLRGDDMAGLA
jgi:hypothetical protein